MSHDTVASLARGDCGPPMFEPYVPGINCLECGHFVGRDGSIEIEHFEMSNEIASVSGTCARCLGGST